MSQPPFLPAPVQQRHDGWTPERQWKFVETLSQTASVVNAARSVGMTVRSAHRLRQHPLGGSFRAAWDAALGQAWGLLEQVALDRAVNGEHEVITRDGCTIAERRKPCSDRLLINLLRAHERTQVAARAERAAAHKVALAEARLAAIQAAADGSARRRGKMGASAMAPLPEPVGDAAAKGAALAAFRALGDGFVPLPELDETLAEAGAAYELHYARLAAQEREAGVAAGDAVEGDAVVGSDAASTGDWYNAAKFAEDYASRPRWEDYRPGGKFADSETG